MTHPEWPSGTIASCLVKAPNSTGVKLQTKDYKLTGKYPIVDQGQDLIAGWTDNEEAVISSNLPLIVFGDHTRIFKYINFPFARGADGTQLLKPRPDINPLFFFYACKAIDMPSRGYNRHYTILKEKEISVPPDVINQEAIGKLLWSCEQSIFLQAREIEATQALKQATMRELFTYGIHSHSVKETEIGMVPQEWDVVNFSAVREWLQYGTSVKCELTKSKYPVLRIPNIESGKVNAEDLKYCSLHPDEAEKYKLENGDLIFIRTNGVLERLGSCAVYDGDPKDALFASYLIRARLKVGLVSPLFIAYFFGSKRGTDLIAGRATPAADGKYNLNTGTIDSLPVPVPPTIDEQNKIAAVLSAIDLKINLQQRKKLIFEKLFKSLLHKFMNGELQIEDLDQSAISKLGIAV